MIGFSFLLYAILTPIVSVEINCLFENVGWSMIELKYSCVVQELRNPEVAEVTHVIGEHETGRENSDVEGFHTDAFGALLMFPRTLARFFPNLVAIALWRNKLTSISSEDFASFPKLELLDLSDNQIETLDGNLFQHTPSLVFVDFASNSLLNIGANLLSNLDNMTYAYFGDNPCSDLMATSREEVETLKIRFVEQCPGECTARCSLSKETDDLKVLVGQQNQKIEEQKAFVAKHSQTIENLSSKAEDQTRRIDEQASLGEAQSLKVRELQDENVSLRSKNSELQGKIDVLQSKSNDYEIRIAKIEKIIKEVQIVP